MGLTGWAALRFYCVLLGFGVGWGVDGVNFCQPLSRFGHPCQVRGWGWRGARVGVVGEGWGVWWETVRGAAGRWSGSWRALVDARGLSPPT